MTKAATTPYRFVGSHVGDLADGRILEPGETYKLTGDDLADPHNKRLIDEGQLLDASPAKASGEGSDR